MTVPGTRRWQVLATMESRTHWTIEQLTAATEAPAVHVVPAIDALQEEGLVRPVSWARHETLFELTPKGHRRLVDRGAQLQLGEAHA
jgi:DNA-binding PadR family transcriptional regulator